ncbi:NAD-dependent epimerase/dehydratase [Thiolapillus brandeum]|uniref:NAD-dependent epimerase/dehydratase n=1 Tax=Thiolapillus brandeum TaxID=1076588 RepID=A0A7U6GGY9_9GAMM|nr:NAD-dependent epimerase/dehydratase [Thiolapillus brandeum]
MLVTGASGRIGARLVQVFLTNGVELRGLYRRLPREQMPGLQAIRGDLLDAESLNAALQGVDLVFHLASYAPGIRETAPEDHPLHREVSVQGTRNLLAASRQAGVRRLVFASSTRVMDGSDSLYARSKKTAESLILAERDSLETVILRLAPVYGFPRQGSIALMLAAIDQGRFPSLPDFAERRSLVHVDDVVQALLLSAIRAEAAGKTFVVTDMQEYSSRRIYELICQALGRTPVPSRIPVWLLRTGAAAGSLLQFLLRRPMPLTMERLDRLRRSAWFDAAPVARELGYRPRYDLQSALPGIIEAYRSGS